jgi:hypothetical protein
MSDSSGSILPAIARLLMSVVFILGVRPGKADMFSRR